MLERRRQSDPCVPWEPDGLAGRNGFAHRFAHGIADAVHRSGVGRDERRPEFGSGTRERTRFDGRAGTRGLLAVGLGADRQRRGVDDHQHHGRCLTAGFDCAAEHSSRRGSRAQRCVGYLQHDFLRFGDAERQRHGCGPTTGYYLAFYDTTVASPAWQTIVGPVQESNNTLTFTGTTSSFTLVAGKLYGFAIFSVSAPAASPPPAPQTDLYFGDNNGLNIADENGNVLKTLAIPSQTFDLDDAGNVYANYNHEGGTAPNAGGSPFFAEFPAGTTSPNAPYLPTANTGIFVSASGAGQAVAVHNPNSAGMLITDIWDPGVTGAPSRTITTNVPTGIGSFAQTHDGTLYLPDTSTAGAPQFDVFPPGATTPSRVIPETIVPSSRYADFAANYAAVGPDGTLYVTEYLFNQPDPSAGVYIYPTSAPERFIPAAFDANGAGPQGVDVDGAGNIYVVNNNVAITGASTSQADSLASVSVYSPAGTLLRTIPGIPSAFPITVAADGTAFVAAFKTQLIPACAVSGSNGIYKIAPGASTATMISTSGSSEVVLYDGTHKTEPFARSSSHGTTFGGRGARIRRPIR